MAVVVPLIDDERSGEEFDLVVASAEEVDAAIAAVARALAEERDHEASH